MRTATKWLTALGMAVAAGAAGHQYYGEAMIDELVSRKASATSSTVAAMPATSPLYREFKKRQAERAAQPAPAPVSPSPWIAAEKRRYLAVLESAPADVLVLPFQMPADGKSPGIDASARTTMAHVTAQRLAAGGVHVADVSYVARALGEPRRLAPDEAAEFGRTVRTRTIVAGEVWHDGAGRMSVRLSTFPSSAAPSSGRTVTREGIAISDTSTPEIAYGAIAGEMLAEIGMGKGGMQSAVRPAAGRALSASPLASIADVRADVSAGIWLQQLMGVLHPANPGRARAEVFERSLAALEPMAPASQDYRVLKARALAHLDRRPAAIALLRRNANGAEERALLAYLDGNVPQLARAAAEIKRPVPRLVAELELVSLRYSYGMTLEELAREAERIVKTVPTEWAPLVIWNVSGLSDWNVRDAMEVKLVLDAHFPLPGFTAESAMQAKSVAGASGDKAWAESQALAFDHASRVLAASGGEWSKPAALWMPRPQQYLDLLTAHAHAMLLRRIEFVCCVQGQRDEGLRLLDVISETVYQNGNAALLLRKAQLLGERLQRTAGREQKLALGQQMHDAATRALQWNTTDPWAAAEASRLELIAGRARAADPARPNRNAAYRDLNDMKSDYPPTLATLRWRDDFNPNGHGSREMRVERACVYSMVSPAPCEAWRRDAEAAGDEKLARRIEKEQLVARFDGSPRRLALLVEAAKSRSDAAAAAAYARESIRTHPAAWAGYDALGSVYRDAGDYKAAAQAYGRYARFRDADGNTVDISNTAYGVAREFARRGAMNEARTFYEIASRNRNGSDAALASAFALAGIERRFGEARAIAEERVRRYPNDETAEAYISLLFALPDVDRGWAAAREALTRYEGFGPWRATAVGLRAKRADADAVMQWSKEFVRAPDYASSPWLDPKAMKALRAATQTLAMDRQPASVDALRAISIQLFPPQALPRQPTPHTPEKKAAAEKLEAMLNPPFGHEQQDRVGDAKSYLERFIAGYARFKSEDYGAAWNAYGHWAHPSGQRETAESLYAALPYYAYSAIKTGKRTELVAYLDRYSKPGKRDKLGNIEPAFPAFDLSLARAVLAAHARDYDVASKELANARASMPRRGLRPLPPAYVYAEICERLAADGVPGVRELVVEWARAHQLHRPWDAWAYAFEAKHSGVEADRVRALAIALQLDPRSARAAELDEPLKRKAEQWLASNRAFPQAGARAAPPRSL